MLFKLSQIMVLTIRKLIVTSQMSICTLHDNPVYPHTINMMLKTIGEFPDHESVIDSTKLIARWLYNHGKLHMMMKTAIGENLVRWNTTHFSTNYLFFESFLRRKYHFM
jgi:hypothetical protein